VSAGEHIHLELTRDFAAAGYLSYRLVPALGPLVPFEAEGLHDGYLLNLFCCKPDWAKSLEARQRLDGVAANEAARRELLQAIPTAPGLADGAYGWRKAASSWACARMLSPAWERHMARNDSSDVAQAIWLHNLSRDDS
jgi:hypothetical protein